jgi:hypothetical protein
MASSLYAALGGKRTPPKAALVTCGLNPPLAVFVVRRTRTVLPVLLMWKERVELLRTSSKIVCTT